MNITKNNAVVTSSGGLLSYIEKFANLFDKFFQNLSDGSIKAIVVSVMPEEYAEQNNIKIQNDKAYTSEGQPVDPSNYPYRCKVKFVEKGDTTEREDDTKVDNDIFNFYLHDVIADKVTKDFGVEIPVNDDGKDVLTDSIINHIDKMIQKVSGSDSSNIGAVNVVKASSDVSVTFKKVTSARSTDIQLVSISAACDPLVAKDVIDDIVSDDAFIEVLPDNEAVSYDIVIDDNEYEVSECDTAIDTSSMFDTILQKLYEVKLSCEYLGITCVGPNCTNISNMCEMVKWEADAEIDFFMKAALRYNHSAPNPICLIKNIEVSQFEAPTLLTIQDTLTCISDTLELYWCNFEKGDQDTITQYLNAWKSNINFNLAKMNGTL